jgi:hypothetical protein
MPHIKGSVLKARMTFLEQHGGKLRTERVLERMSEADRTSLKNLTYVRWYPFDLGERLDAAIVHVLGHNDPAFFLKLGEASADRNLATVHSNFLTQGDAHGFLQKAGVLYALYYDTGRREYTRVDDKTAYLTTYDSESFSAADCLTVVGWYRRALELCSVTKPKVEETECRAKGAPYCRYKVTWG